MNLDCPAWAYGLVPGPTDWLNAKRGSAPSIVVFLIMLQSIVVFLIMKVAFNHLSVWRKRNTNMRRLVGKYTADCLVTQSRMRLRI